MLASVPHPAPGRPARAASFATTSEVPAPKTYIWRPGCARFSVSCMRLTLFCGTDVYRAKEPAPDSAAGSALAAGLPSGVVPLDEHAATTQTASRWFDRPTWPPSGCVRRPAQPMRLVLLAMCHL